MDKLQNSAQRKQRRDLPRFGLTEQPTTCPYCGSRTRFTEYANRDQHHVCLNPDCGFEFIGEDF